MGKTGHSESEVLPSSHDVLAMVYDYITSTTNNWTLHLHSELFFSLLSDCRSGNSPTFSQRFFSANWLTPHAVWIFDALETANKLVYLAKTHKCYTCFSHKNKLLILLLLLLLCSAIFALQFSIFHLHKWANSKGAKHLMLLQHRIGLPTYRLYLSMYFYVFVCKYVSFPHFLCGFDRQCKLLVFNAPLVRGKCGKGGALELWVYMFLKGPSITMMGWKEVSEGILCKYANYTWITKTYWIMYFQLDVSLNVRVI